MRPQLEELRELSKQQSSDSKEREPEQEIDLTNRIVPENLPRIEAIGVAKRRRLIESPREKIEEERERVFARTHLEFVGEIRI